MLMKCPMIVKTMPAIRILSLLVKQLCFQTNGNLTVLASNLLRAIILIRANHTLILLGKSVLGMTPILLMLRSIKSLMIIQRATTRAMMVRTTSLMAREVESVVNTRIRGTILATTVPSLILHRTRLPLTRRLNQQLCINLLQRFNKRSYNHMDDRIATTSLTFLILLQVYNMLSFLMDNMAGYLLHLNLSTLLLHHRRLWALNRPLQILAQYSSTTISIISGAMTLTERIQEVPTLLSMTICLLM